MPIYEYECSDCNHYFDELQKMNDDPLLDCPVCNKPKLKRLLSAPSFRLKGSGWYETDFKNTKKNINSIFHFGEFSRIYQKNKDHSEQVTAAVWGNLRI